MVDKVTVKLRTSDEWMDLLYPDLEVRDPDGWDRSPGNFTKSWNELITEEEFERRFSYSTVGSKHA